MSILDEILTQKREEVALLDETALRRAAEASPAPRDFLGALSAGRSKNAPALIAEIKRASPSRGLLAPHLDPDATAGLYAANGAAAISVLTDETFFKGSLEILRRLRFERRISLPLLRKDFVIHAAQVYEARAAGADAVLLIAAALPDDARFAALHALACELGLTALVEVHDEAELERALRLKDVRLIGVNNRDLGTFRVDLAVSERLRARIPAGITVVAESGIHSAADVARLRRAGVDAVLVGEALVTAPDPAAKVREIAFAACDGEHK